LIQTQDVISSLKDGLTMRFFLRYHPVLSLKKWAAAYGSRRKLHPGIIMPSDFKYDYVFEMLCFFFPKTKSMRIIRSLCKAVPESIGDVAGWPKLINDYIDKMCRGNEESFRERHANLIIGAITNQITQLMMIEAKRIVSVREG